MSNQILIYVDLFQGTQNPLARIAGRPQRWRWRAVNGFNHRTLAVSSEAYSNKSDAVSAITQLFGTDSNIYLRSSGTGNQLLRLAG